MKKEENIREKCNNVILRFNIIYYVMMIIGVFAQYIHSKRMDQAATLIAAGLALVVVVISFFITKSRTIYGKISLGIGCAFFSIINLTYSGSEVMLLLIPFCTLSLLISEREMISLMFTLWIGNAIARIIMMVFREGTTVVQYKNYLWILFICFMFAVALSMVNNEFGIFYRNDINRMQNKENTEINQ